MLQVYLRSTLSKGRAEILQLETLENIASCLQPAAAGGKGGGGADSRQLRDRLDVFRAVSFARQLAAHLAKELEGAVAGTSTAIH